VWVMPGNEPDEEERLRRFLTWRRAERETSPANARHTLSYVAGATCFTVGVLVLGFITTLMTAQRPGRQAATVGSQPAPSETSRHSKHLPLGPLVERDRFPSALPQSSAQLRAVPTVRPERPARPLRDPRAASGAASVSRPSTPTPPARTSRLRTTVATVNRWVGYMPEVRAGKALVRWVKSQPPPDGRRLPDPEPHQAQ